MENERLKIGITQGDTNGVGWEVILKSLANPLITELCTPILYGSPKAAGYYRNTLREVENIALNTISGADYAREGRVNIIPVGEGEIKIEPGVATPISGKAAVDALRRATEDLKQGLIDALVTAPICKEAVQSEEFHHTGHTEYLAAELGGDPLMMMCSDRLRVGLVTIHIPVSEISRSITREKIVERLNQLRALLKQDFGIVEPRIAVLSLNPHAGDGGLLGPEEEEIIRPAILEAYEQGVLAYGPFAADGLFASGNYTAYDAVLAMYHDQGLAPFKMLAPDGVNYTACLDRVRTSPDHGVAYDIAGKDKADPQSMRSAIYLAIDIVRNRRAWEAWNENPLQHVEPQRKERDHREPREGREGRENRREPSAEVLVERAERGEKGEYAEPSQRTEAPKPENSPLPQEN